MAMCRDVDGTYCGYMITLMGEFDKLDTLQV